LVHQIQTSPLGLQFFPAAQHDCRVSRGRAQFDRTTLFAVSPQIKSHASSTFSVLQSFELPSVPENVVPPRSKIQKCAIVSLHFVTLLNQPLAGDVLARPLAGPRSFDVRRSCLYRVISPESESAIAGCGYEQLKFKLAFRSDKTIKFHLPSGILYEWRFQNITEHIRQEVVRI
jgi:hypothetical protein